MSEVSAMLVDTMHLRVPSGGGSKILACGHKGGLWAGGGCHEWVPWVGAGRVGALERPLLGWGS